MQEQNPPEQAGSGMEPQNVVATMENERRIKGGANWFYWIAALSVINTLIFVLSDSETSFVVGLAITQLVDAIAEITRTDIGGDVATVVSVIAFAINLAIAGVFVLFGLFAHRGQRWAFVVGMVFYVLDGLLYLAFLDILAVAFHAWALFGLWRGLRALNATSKDVAPDSYGGMSAG